MVRAHNARNTVLENICYSKRARYETPKRNERVSVSLSIIAEIFIHYIPQNNRAIITSTGKCLPIWTKCYAINNARVSCTDGSVCASGYV